MNFSDNIWLVVFCFAVGCIMTFVRFKEYKTITKTIQEATDGKKFEKYDYSKWVRILYIVFLLFGVVSLVYGIFEKDYETVSMGVVLTLMFIGELLIVGPRYTLYYSDTHFITGGKLARYKSIRDFEEMKYFKLAFVRAVTFNGEKLPMSRKAYEIVKEQMKKKK